MGWETEKFKGISIKSIIFFASLIVVVISVEPMEKNNNIWKWGGEKKNTAGSWRFIRGLPPV